MPWIDPSRQPTIRRVRTVEEVASSLAERTRPEAAATWDPVGLQLGSPDAEVESIAVCHEVTTDVLSALEKEPVDLLITYHPLLFVPTNRLAGRSGPGARAFALIEMGANLLVTHTDFDAAPGGAADALAEFFDLREVKSFGDGEEGEPQIGRVGTFEGSLETVDARLADAFGFAGMRVSGDPDRDVERLAVVPGSGAGFIEAAAEVADALVTGDVSHHRVVRARDLDLAIVDPGHIVTERPGMEALVELVKDVTGSDVVDLTHFDPQTWI